MNRRFGMGGASRAGGLSIWPGLRRLFGPVAGPDWEALGKEAALFGSESGPPGILTPTSVLDLWDACARQADRANHNPPAASSAAIARNRCFAFIVFCLLIQASPSLSQRHCARIFGSRLSVWNEGGEFWSKTPASRNEPDPESIMIANIGPGREAREFNRKLHHPRLFIPKLCLRISAVILFNETDILLPTPFLESISNPARLPPRNPLEAPRYRCFPARNENLRLYRNSSFCWISRIGRVVG